MSSYCAVSINMRDVVVHDISFVPESNTRKDFTPTQHSGTELLDLVIPTGKSSVVFTVFQTKEMLPGKTYSFRLLAVLSGTNSMEELQNGSDHPLKYPFPDLASSGCLMVHTLSNPRVEEIRKLLDSFQPDLVCLQGEQLPNAQVGSMVCAGAELSSAEDVCGLFNATVPTTVYLEIPSGEDIAKALHSKGIPNVIYWVKKFTCFVACHFRHALYSVLQSSACHIWDAFMLACASWRVYCVKDDDVFGPCFLGNRPKIDVRRYETAAGDDDDEHGLLIIHDVDGSRFLQSLERGLSALLGIEIRGSELRKGVSVLPRPLPVGIFSHGVTMRCDLSTTSSSNFQLLVSGSAQTCLNEQVLENNLKSELMVDSQLVNADCEENKICLSEARKSAAVAGGAPVFQVYMKFPKWASQVLRQLARDSSYRGLVALGIARIQGVNVASFEKDDAQRLLFFCNRQGKKPSSANTESLSYPSSLRPRAPSRIREETGSICDTGFTSGSQAVDERDAEESEFVVAIRHVSHIQPLGSPLSDAGVHDGTEAREDFLAMPSSRAQPSVSFSVKMKKHGCGRSPFHVCSEEEFLKDLMQFLTRRGHTKLIPKGGFSEFPATILYKKRLDLFNMYKEVVSIGGFHVGDGINWKRQVFLKMKNFIVTNTGVRRTLRRFYEMYLLEYELAHDDVDGNRCLFCHSGAAGDWIKCGTCREWAHHGCDKRPRPVIRAFEDYAERGREYTCPQCTIANFKKRIQKGKYAF